MREIKFRGKAKDGVWVYGSYVYAHKWFGDGKAGHFICDIYGDCRDLVDSKTVGQFTGLYDKNGKEIYEGDIIKDQYENREIVFNRIGWDSGFGLTGFVSVAWWEREDYNIQGFYDADRCIYDNELEVVGNRWDNPELLKENKNGKN